MAIPLQHQGRFVYHFTHLDNLPGILANGLLSRNEQARRGLGHHTIASDSIQQRRANMAVTCPPGGVVHDYVPFYFCKRSSMLLSVVLGKNVDQHHLIYLALPIATVDRPGVVFTDASANTEVPPRFFNDSDSLSELPWAQIDDLRWTLPEADKQARMAEVLVPTQVPIADVAYIVRWNQSVESHISEQFRAAGLVAPRMEGNGKHYFMPIGGSRANYSIVSGPIVTRAKFKAQAEFLAAAAPAVASRYSSIEDANTALDHSLEALPETAELIGLATDNPMHPEDIGTHTQTVVQLLVASPQYLQLNPREQSMVKLAAYLHDIGKGPRARWATAAGTIHKANLDSDHPLRSVEMLGRILTQDIGGWNAAEARTLVKLVCYHDLIGDIAGRGRRPEQLFAIIENTRDLAMLDALCRADMGAVLGGANLDARYPRLNEVVGEARAQLPQ